MRKNYTSDPLSNTHSVMPGSFCNTKSRKLQTIFLSSLVMMLSFFALTTQAQVMNYNFSQTTSTYTPVSGTNVTANNWDNNIVPLTIPFIFNFDGTGYTNCVL